MKRDWYRIEAKAQQDTADIYVFGDIGKSYWDDDTVTASKFIADLGALPDSVKTIRVHVNSYGGSVFEAHAIANALRAQRSDKGRAVEVTIEGIAASAATIITSAGSPIRIADNAMMMIHEPSALEFGTSRAMRKMADALDGIRNSIIAAYRWVSSKTEEELSALMAETTWMDPEEAVAAGLATEVVAGVEAVALLPCQGKSPLEDVPEKFQARVSAILARAEPAPPAPPAPTPAAAADVLKACAQAGLDLAFAQAIVGESLTIDGVSARVTAEVTARRQAADHASAVRQLCAAAHLPELADSYIAGSMPIDQVRAQLTVMTAKVDQAQIDSALPPDGSKAKAAAGLNVTAIYNERNSRRNKE